MKTMLGGLLIALGTMGCAPTPGLHYIDCYKVVLAEPIRLAATGDSVIMTTQSDTMPKPHSTCITVYAQTKDTFPKP